MNNTTENKKYAVHLFTQVRVKIAGVEAGDAKEAFAKADQAVGAALHSVLDQSHMNHALDGGMKVEEVECADEAPECALVDTLLANGEVDYDKPVWLDGEGYKLVNGCTAQEIKAQGFDRATKFMSELLDSVETLTGIAEQQGVGTLADLLYLQTAILNNTFCEFNPSQTNVFEIIEALPSAAEWQKFIQIEEADVPLPPS